MEVRMWKIKSTVKSQGEESTEEEEMGKRGVFQLLKVEQKSC